MAPCPESGQVTGVTVGSMQREVCAPAAGGDLLPRVSSTSELRAGGGRRGQRGGIGKGNRPQKACASFHKGIIGAHTLQQPYSSSRPLIYLSSMYLSRPYPSSPYPNAGEKQAGFQAQQNKQKAAFGGCRACLQDLCVTLASVSWSV